MPEATGGLNHAQSRVKASRPQSRIRGEPIIGKPSTFVGLDAHKDTIVVAMLGPGSAPVVEWRIVNEPGAVRRLAEKLQRALPAWIRELGPANSFSIGIVTFLEPPRDIDQMFGLAD